jgi:hypothetical protein
MAIAWPIASLIESVQNCRRVVPARLTPRSRLGLIWWVWTLALRQSVPPVEALAYRLYEPDSTDPGQWWYTLEATSLSRQLTDTSAKNLAADKSAFADWCDANGLRHIPTLALATRKGWARPFDGGRPPPRDLLLKPCRGAQGRAVEGWHWRGNCFHRDARRLSAEVFMAYVLHHASAEEMLVQPLLTPPPALDFLAGKGMPAARVITGRWPDGRVELGPGMLQAPLPGELISQSGPFRLIDTVTGEVAVATPRQTKPVFDVPLGAGFDGIVLPGWADASASLVRAHSLFPGRAPIIGWDLLFDDSGPLICEANIGISYYFFQQAGAQPMAATSLGRMMETWLEWRG